MNYYSLNKKAPNTTFEDAVIKGLAPDRGLYFPETITLEKVAPNLSGSCPQRYNLALIWAVYIWQCAIK